MRFANKQGMWCLKKIIYQKYYLQHTWGGRSKHKFVLSDAMLDMFYSAEGFRATQPDLPQYASVHGRNNLLAGELNLETKIKKEARLDQEKQQVEVKADITSFGSMEEFWQKFLIP